MPERILKPVSTVLLAMSLLAGTKAAATTVILDTDMAIDDWAALLFLEAHEELDLVAITVSASGESHCEPGMRNALALAELVNPDAQPEVACGDPWPLDGFLVFPEAWQEDADTLSGIEIPASTRMPETMHAVELIHKILVEQSLLQQSPDAATAPVVMVATGPMTNIAQWLEKYPEDAAMVSRLVIMGGNLDVPGNIIVPGFSDGNPNLHAEWNFYIDPIAADQVLRSGLPIELVGLDVTNDVRVTAKFAADFKAAVNNPATRFWDQVLDNNDWFIASGEYYFWDVLAALVVANQPQFCQGEMMALGAAWQYTNKPYLASSDLSMPSSRNNGAVRRHIDATTAGVVHALPEGSQRNVLFCRHSDADAAFRVYTDTLAD